ncbi:oxygenase MpaB family protein [Variovorax sp. RT4R15]|uniref:oxygenase MpaB family protein n=1 Tax=Variovorax sp. RT4R15 TaxID=3443737 RepID=UPI003F4554C9
MTFAASTPTLQDAERPVRGHRWISREIARLNPESDYARIWQLTVMYYTDETLANLLYTTGMPCFTQSPYGSELLISRTRKAQEHQHERAYDTLSHFWRWFEYGPEHIEAQRSVERVNRIHEALAQGLPEAFSNDDFIYTTSWLGTFLHRLRLMLGLSGFSDKQKVAAHHFWRGIMMKMRGPQGYVQGYPEDFAAMEAFVDEFESRPWAPCETGRLLGQYAIRQFNEARLPKPLWGLGRQLVLTVQAPHIRRLHRMGDPNPVAAWLIRRALFLKVWMAENVLPDPKAHAPQRARGRGDTNEQHRVPPMVDAAQCPFHAAGKTLQTKSSSACPFHH